MGGERCFGPVEFTRGVDREAVLGSAGGLLTLPFGIAQGTKNNDPSLIEPVGLARIFATRD